MLFCEDRLARRSISDRTAPPENMRLLADKVSTSLRGLAMLAAILAGGAALAGTGNDFLTATAAPRRLTAQQYRNIIGDVFGPNLDLGGRFEPDMRVDGLLEVGASRVSVSPFGMEQYDIMARTIASQVLDAAHRDLVMPCKPKAKTESDDVCAATFITEVGQLLFRRPLTSAERTAYVSAAQRATLQVKDFYTGLSMSLAALLASPQFLFREDTLEPDPNHKGEYVLDAYSMASRLSFFLWNTIPDRELLAAADKGDLSNSKRLARQVDRMLSSPRLEDGLRAFFSDMLHLDELGGIAKDSVIYPKFSSQVAMQAREQTLKTIIQITLTERRDYREIFTTKKTYLTPELAALYRLPLTSDMPNGSPSSWQSYEFPNESERAGILTHASFLLLYSHPGRSSATLRGKALREVLLCQRVPPPPGDVKFNLVQDTGNPLYRTARDRLKAHVSEPLCAGCHKLTDPIGLGLENFDGGASFRAAENGAPIDASGQLDNKRFTDAVSLSRAVHDNPATTACLVNRLSGYSLGRALAKTDKSWVDKLRATFSESGYVVPDLLRVIATSPDFYHVAPAPDLHSLQSTMLMMQKASRQLENMNSPSQHLAGLTGAGDSND